jgi:hypothetical protein
MWRRQQIRMWRPALLRRLNMARHSVRRTAVTPRMRHQRVRESTSRQSTWLQSNVAAINVCGNQRVRKSMLTSINVDAGRVEVSHCPGGSLRLLTTNSVPPYARDFPPAAALAAGGSAEAAHRAARQRSTQRSGFASDSPTPAPSDAGPPYDRRKPCAATRRFRPEAINRRKAMCSNPRVPTGSDRPAESRVQRPSGSDWKRGKRDPGSAEDSCVLLRTERSVRCSFGVGCVAAGAGRRG